MDQEKSGIERYSAILKEQNMVCAICLKEEVARNRSKLIRSLSVDHNHTTGEIRGLLCHGCNLMLGNAREDIATLRSAIRYLEKWTK